MRYKITGILTCLSMIFLDQLSKWAVTEHIISPYLNPVHEPVKFHNWFENAEKLDFTRIEVTPFFNWVMVWNKGISFGMLQTDSQMEVWLMIGFAALISSVFLVWMLKAETNFLIFSLSLVIGGALGNIIDRFRFGAVIDFLEFHIDKYTWPAFNFADSCITLGIAFILIDGVFLEPKRKKVTDSK